MKPSIHGKLRNPPPGLLVKENDTSFEKALMADDVYQNADKLGLKLGLTEAEKRLLALVAHWQASNTLYGASTLIKNQPFRSLCVAVADVLSVSEGDMLAALHISSVLRETELLRLDLRASYGRMDITDILQIDDDLAELLLIPGMGDARLMQLFYRNGGEASLGEEDLSPRTDELPALRALLSTAVSQTDRGVNILIYGPPGTGKTELAKWLAGSLGYEAAMVPEVESDGVAMSASKRLRRYHACQTLLAKESRTVVVFDEAEDALCQIGDVVPKAAMTQFLELNTTPTLWIANRVDMDPALMRRFTHLLKLDYPGRDQRERIARQLYSELRVGEPLIQEVASLEALSPGVLQASADFARFTRQEGHDAEVMVRKSLNNRLEAMGRQERLEPKVVKSLPWRAQYINTSEDLTGLLHSMNPDVPARFCLHGPPGTGKTAWAVELARSLGKPLMVRQAADLLGMFVGQTEGAIADMFNQAERRGGVLVIDEADTFLGKRAAANQAWEVSHVNQFLASMERYQGIFVATTNLLSRIDNAAMRRFDFTVEFRYLTIKSRVQLFEDLTAAYSILIADRQLVTDRLSAMSDLTPGDFSVVYRKLRVLTRHPDVLGILKMIEDVRQYKEEVARPIGFKADLNC